VKPHRFHPEADAEYAKAAEYYATIQAELGGRFFDEIESLISDVCENPMRWKEFDPPARRRLAFGFPYAVVYIDEPDCVWIVAVMPLRREPGYWKERLP
jgi:toxin ParE1/3/4